jgi:hypothetical protein
MYHMRTAKVRKRMIARLVPERPKATPALPDFLARLKEIYGNKTLKVSGAELIRAERDEGY